MVFFSATGFFMPFSKGLLKIKNVKKEFILVSFVLQLPGKNSI